MEKEKLFSLALGIGKKLKDHKLTLGVVESATGGLISEVITGIPGSSDYYQGSITSYSNEIKMRLAGVKRETLEKYGAVSAKVAEEMAGGGRKVLGVDICVADTGIAGPTGATPGKPVGLFYLGLSHRDGTFNRKHIFRGDREQNREQAAAAALEWVREYLDEIIERKEASRDFSIKKVVTCILEADKKILIMRRSSGVSTYQGRWAAVSGYVENEPDTQALIEIREETALDERDIRLDCKGKPLEVRDEALKTIWIVQPYLFHVYHPEKIKLEREHVEAKWIDPGEVMRYQTVPKLKEAIEAVIHCG
ncbi:MAG: nicotinamide-nucleotide amidohydrolase family protein [Dehalococcoidales bacterium]|nr:nicotinamide-nucleotide amidohydrolase family protein [Dehalococcoidales bacterium]